MKHVWIVGKRVITQLRHDKRLLGISIVGPLLIMYFLKIFLDALNVAALTARYVIPYTAFIVHFLAFLLCAIVLVQERTAGTLERMFIAGFRRGEVIGGYIVGYFGLATLQAVVVLTETLWLFQLDYGAVTLFNLFLVIWLLAIVSVLFGIFISTFARREAHVFPFIPLVILPEMFLSGMMVDVEKLPVWGQWLGRLSPLHYANNAVQELIKGDVGLDAIWRDLVILMVYAVVLLVVASRTLPEVE